MHADINRRPSNTLTFLMVATDMEALAVVGDLYQYCGSPLHHFNSFCLTWNEQIRFPYNLNYKGRVPYRDVDRVGSLHSYHRQEAKCRVASPTGITRTCKDSRNSIASAIANQSQFLPAWSHVFTIDRNLVLHGIAKNGYRKSESNNQLVCLM